jgi:STAS-like domain of unknown function (DUF4325)
MRFSLSSYGRAFSTRPRGVALLSELEGKASDARNVEIDFSGVTSISYSFADEFVGVLFQRAGEGAYAFEPHLVHVPPALRRVILRSLRFRDVQISPDELFGELAVH